MRYLLRGGGENSEGSQDLGEEIAPVSIRPSTFQMASIYLVCEIVLERLAGWFTISQQGFVGSLR